jgi:UDP-N-acetyl-D-mannosaminuronic acid dehydrogenase
LRPTIVTILVVPISKPAKLEFQLKEGRKPSIAIMGLAFKPNIDDLRESPAKYIAQKVLQNANNDSYFIVEPNIKSHNVFKLTNYKEAAEKADIIVFLVAHDEFKTLNLSCKNFNLVIISTINNASLNASHNDSLFREAVEREDSLNVLT